MTVMQTAAVDRLPDRRECEASAEAELFLLRQFGSPVERSRATETLVARHDRVVRWAAGLYAGRGESTDVLRQVAYVGLLEAIRRFDPNRGNDFISFAVPTVLGEIRRHFRDGRRCMRVPRRIYHLQVRIRDKSPELEQRLRRRPTVPELAEALEVTGPEVTEALCAYAWLCPPSLDSPVSTEDPAGRAIPFEDGRFATLIDLQSLAGLVSRLSEREKAILGMRFYEDKSQSQIGVELGISQMHVSRLLARTLRNLRAGLDSEPEPMRRGARA